MLYDLLLVGSTSVRALLAERAVPASVVWLGDERFGDEETRAIPESRPRILVDFDPDGQDIYTPAVGVGRAAIGSTLFACEAACEAIVEGATTKPGATVHDHQRVVRRVADAFAVALLRACHVRRIALPSLSGRFIDLGAQGGQAGARYRFSFSLHRAVLDAPFATVDGSTLGVANTTTVQIGNTEASVCGGD